MEGVGGNGQKDVAKCCIAELWLLMASLFAYLFGFPWEQQVLEVGTRWIRWEQLGEGTSTILGMGINDLGA